MVLFELGSGTVICTEQTVDITPGPGCETLQDTVCGLNQCAIEGEPTSSDLHCAPASTESVDLTCNAETISFVRTTSCSCQSIPLFGEIHGIILLSNGEPADNVLIITNSQQILKTETDGRFFLSVDSASGSVVITLSDFISQNDRFFPELHVLTYTAGGISYATIILKPKPPPVATFPATTGIVLSTSLGPLTSITIEANSIYTSLGSPYSGEVSLFASISDVSSVDALENEIGVFQTQTNDGETILLDTSGIIFVYAADTNGNILTIQREVTFTFDTATLPDGTNLYVLNQNTGGWNFITNLVESQDDSLPDTGTGGDVGLGLRKKRQIGTGVIGGQTTVKLLIPPSLPCINLDRPVFRDRLCTVTVFVFQDEGLTMPFQGITVKVFIPQENAAGFVGVRSATTDRSGRVCLPIACGIQNHVIRAYGPNTPGSIGIQSPVSPTTQHNLPDDYTFENQENQIVFTPDNRTQLLAMDPLDGPVYPEFNDNPGARTCFDSTTNDHHFQFVVPTPTPQGKLFAVEPRDGLELSWYTNNANNMGRVAAFIAVEIVVSGTNRKVLANTTPFFYIDIQEPFLGPFYFEFTLCTSVHGILFFFRRILQVLLYLELKVCKV